MYDDYKPYLSNNFFTEFDFAMMLYRNEFLAGIFDRFNLDMGYYLFRTVGTEGITYPSKTLTDMGSYIKIVSLPTDHSAGVAYLFHETAAGDVYYLSVFMYSNEAVEKLILKSAASIEAPSTVDASSSAIAGTFHFDLISSNELVSYEIYDISLGTTIGESLTGSIGAGLNTYSHTVPIAVNIPGSSQNVAISVRGIDINGNSIEASASHYITRTITGGSVSNANLTINGTTVLMSDTRGNEIFDVSQGIPTTEDLYANIFVNEYLTEETYTQYVGSRDYTVVVSREYDYNGSSIRTIYGQNTIVTDCTGGYISTIRCCRWYG